MGTEDFQDYHLHVASANPAALRGMCERVTARGVVLTTLAAEYPRDVHCLAKLYALAQTIHNHPTWTLAEYMERFDNWEAVFIAKIRTRYVGYTYLVRDAHHTERLLQCMTGVHPEWRRQGIATALKACTLEYVQCQGYQTIVTHNHGANAAILTLNAKVGFRPVQMDVSNPDDAKS